MFTDRMSNLPPGVSAQDIEAQAGDGSDPAALIVEIEDALGRADKARREGRRADEIGHMTEAQARAEDLAELTHTPVASELAARIRPLGCADDRAFDLLDRVRVARGVEE